MTRFLQKKSDKIRLISSVFVNVIAIDTESDFSRSFSGAYPVSVKQSSPEAKIRLTFGRDGAIEYRAAIGKGKSRFAAAFAWL
ncbi:MAG: hypothetical protein AAF067_03005 [Pseudomonadota bacterium]